jgi:hypothetical protein
MVEYMKQSGGYTYILPPAEKSPARKEYDFFATSMTKDNLLKDIRWKTLVLQDLVSTSFKVVDRQKNRDWSGSLEIDTEIPELFYGYAVEGIPGFVMGGGKELSDETLEKKLWDSSLNQYDFMFEWNAIEAYNILLGGLDDLVGNSHSFALDVIVNKFAARLNLDTALYTEDPAWLSIAEVALLAGMKEKSVRNAAHKEIGAVSNAKSGMTMIRADKALNWLKSRRKFVPSYKLKSQKCIDALMDIRANFGGYSNPQR